MGLFFRYKLDHILLIQTPQHFPTMLIKTLQPRSFCGPVPPFQHHHRPPCLLTLLRQSPSYYSNTSSQLSSLPYNWASRCLGHCPNLHQARSAPILTSNRCFTDHMKSLLLILLSHVHRLCHHLKRRCPCNSELLGPMHRLQNGESGPSLLSLQLAASTALTILPAHSRDSVLPWQDHAT